MSPIETGCLSAYGILLPFVTAIIIIGRALRTKKVQQVVGTHAQMMTGAGAIVELHAITHVVYRGVIAAFRMSDAGRAPSSITFSSVR